MSNLSHLPYVYMSINLSVNLNALRISTSVNVLLELIVIYLTVLLLTHYKNDNNGVTSSLFYDLHMVMQCSARAVYSCTSRNNLKVPSSQLCLAPAPPPFQETAGGSPAVSRPPKALPRPPHRLREGTGGLLTP